MKYLYLTFIIFFSCNNEKEFIHPEIKQVIEAVYASGETHAENNYIVTSLSSGQIENIYFEQGD